VQNSPGNATDPSGEFQVPLVTGAFLTGANVLEINMRAALVSIEKFLPMMDKKQKEILKQLQDIVRTHRYRLSTNEDVGVRPAVFAILYRGRIVINRNMLPKLMQASKDFVRFFAIKVYHEAFHDLVSSGQLLIEEEMEAYEEELRLYLHFLDFELYFDPFLNEELNQWVGGTLRTWVIKMNPLAK
jgi:hypothetical protein